MPNLYDKKQSILRKWGNPWAHEFSTKTISDNSRSLLLHNIDDGDRFIPQRCNRSYDKQSQYYKIDDLDLKSISKISDLKNLKQNSFRQHFLDVFQINECRLFSFSSKPKFKREYEQSNITYDWLCKPRKRPMAFCESTHEIPDFNPFAVDRNLSDWSSYNQLVVAHDTYLIVWNCNERKTCYYNVENARSVKFSPNGKKLAFGYKCGILPILELWSVYNSNKFVVYKRKVFKWDVCDILCIDWSKMGDILVCGTAWGKVYILTACCLRETGFIEQNLSPISTVQFSPTMQYLATANIDGKAVIYEWPSKNVLLCIQFFNEGQIFLEWHPWSDDQLVIAEQCPATISVLRLSERNVVSRYQRTDMDMKIDDVTFSKLTGELVVSISKFVENDESQTEIVSLVLASLDYPVDTMNSELTGGARVLAWSPDGTQVATCGINDNISIWHFYTKTNNKIPTRRSKEGFAIWNTIR